MPLRYKCALLGGQYYDSDFRDDVGRIDLFVKRATSLKKSSEGVAYGQNRQYRWRNIGGYIAASGLKYDQEAVQSMAKMANQVNQVSAKWKVTSQQLDTNFTKQLDWFLATKVGELYEQIRIMEAIRKNYDKLKGGKKPEKTKEMGDLFMAHKAHVQTLIDKVKVEMEVFRPCAYAWIAAEQEFNAFAKATLSSAGSIPTKSTYDRLATYKKDKEKQAKEKSSRSSRSNKSNKSNKSSKRRVISIKIGRKQKTASVMKNPDSNSAKSSKSKMSAPGGKSMMGSVAKSKMAPVDSSSKSSKSKMTAPTGKSMMGAADASDKNNNKSKASKMAPVETSGKVRKGKSKGEGKSAYKSVASQPGSAEGSKMKEPNGKSSMEGVEKKDSKEKSNEEKSKSNEVPK